MAKKGKGSGDSVGSASVDIVGNLEPLIEQLAQVPEMVEATVQQGAAAAQKATSGARDKRTVGGKDASPLAANVDAKVKTKVEGSVAKDIQAAIDTTDYQLTIDTGSIRKQIEVALQRAFDITINAKITGEAGAEAAGAHANLEQTRGPSVARGAPPPEVLKAMTDPIREAVNNVYRNLNELLAKANKPAFGRHALTPGNEIEKATELIGQFGTKFSDMLNIDASGKGKPKVLGGSMTPQALAESLGIDPKDPTMKSLQNNLRGFTSPGEGGQSPSRATDLFFSRLDEWNRAGGGVASTSVEQPVVQQVVRTVTSELNRQPDPVAQERVNASEQEARELRQATIAERQAALRIDPINPQQFNRAFPGVIPGSKSLKPSDDPEADAAARRALGIQERSNVRRRSQRVPNEAVAGIDMQNRMEPLLRLAAMGRFSNVFERFGGKGNKESQGLVRIEPENEFGFEEVQRLRGGKPGVKRSIAGQEGMFAHLRPQEAFLRVLTEAMGVGEDAASREEVRAYTERPEVAEQIKRQLAVGGRPMTAARSKATPGGPSSETKRGQGSTGFGGIGTGGQLGQQATRLIDWIDSLESRIEGTANVIERLNRDIERGGGRGDDVTGLEAQRKDLGKQLRELGRKRNEARQELDVLTETRTPEQARAMAAASAARGEEYRARVAGSGRGSGLTPAEVGEREFRKPEKVGARARTALEAMGLTDLSAIAGRRDFSDMLSQRYLSEPSMVRPGTGKDIVTGEEEKGRILTGQTALREHAFGSSGKGGIFGELVGRIPDDLGREATKEVTTAIRNTLENAVKDQSILRGFLEEDVAKREPMSGPRKFMSDVSPEQARERGYTGEGQFRYAPGQQAALEADIEVNEGRRTRLAEIDKILRPSTVTKPAIPASGKDKGIEARTEEVLNPDRRFSAANIEALKQERRVLKGEYTDPEKLRTRLAESQARQALEAGEATTAEATRAQTQGRRTPITGEESTRMAAGRGDILMEEEVPPLPFEDIARQYGTGQGPRTRQTGGPRDVQPPSGGGGGGGDAEGGFEFTGAGPIPVIVTNVPLAVAFSGEISTGGGRRGPDERQGQIVGASRKIADLGAQTSPEFQDAFRMEAQRLTQAGMKANDVRKLAREMGLGPAAAMYYGTQPAAAPAGAGGAGGTTPPAGPRDTGFGPEFQVLPDDFAVKQTARQRALQKPLYSQPAGPEYLPFGPSPVPTPGGQPMRTVISPQQRAIEQAERDQKADDRRREADIRSARRQAQVNDPLGLARERDVADTSLKDIRGENRAIQRRVPRRGFGASITDLITSAFPGGALERQLEAADRAQREVNEINQAAEKRSGLITQRRGVIEQARAERGPDGRLSERGRALFAQAAELGRSIAIQNTVIKESSRIFGENSKIVRDNTKAAFGAAAVGSIGSIGIGALTFGIGSALVAPIITGVSTAITQGLGPILERAGGFAGTTTRITGEFAGEIRARGGDTGAVAGGAARTGLAADTFQRISPLITARAQGEAGNQALQAQIDLLHTFENLSRQQLASGVDKSLIAATGSPIPGTSFFGIPSTQEQIVKEFADIAPREERAQYEAQGGGEPVPYMLGDTVLGQGPGSPEKAMEGFVSKVDLATSRMEFFNDQAEKGGSSMKFVSQEGDDLAVSIKAARDAGLTELAKTFEEKEVGIQGARSGDDVLSFLQSIQRGATTPSPRLLLEDTERQRRAQVETRQVQTEFRTGTLIPQQDAIALAQRPFSDASAGIEFSKSDDPETRDRIKADLKITQGLYNDINKEIDIGIAAAKDFVTYGADIAGFGDNVGGLGAEAGKQFADSLDRVRSIGKQIAGIEIGLQTKNAAYQAAQFSYQIGIAKRSLNDALGLAGKITDSEKDNLGVLERQQFFLQRRAQALQLEQSQRQINFQRAVAGFTAPGLTGEERAARIQQAKIEADFAQKQLNIQKELFGLQGRSFQITASRQVTDLTGQLGLLEEGREIVLETAAAEKKIRALTAIQEKETKKVQALYEAAIETTNDIIKQTGELSAATGKHMGELANDVLQAYAKVLAGLINQTSVAAQNLAKIGVSEDAPYRHAGGNVMRGSTYTVQGDELFTPGENGMMTPAEMLPQITPMTGSSTQAAPITILITGNKFNTEEEMKQLEVRITDAVQRAQSRQLSLLGGRSY